MLFPQVPFRKEKKSPFLETVTTLPGSWHHSQPASLLNVTDNDQTQVN